MVSTPHAVRPALDAKAAGWSGVKVSIFAHVVFGLVLGWAYPTFARPRD